MKYTDEEIKNKFSDINFDKTGNKKQAIFNKIIAEHATGSFNMRKRYQYLLAVSAVILIAVPSIMMLSKYKYSEYKYSDVKPVIYTQKPVVPDYSKPDIPENQHNTYTTHLSSQEGIDINFDDDDMPGNRTEGFRPSLCIIVPDGENQGSSCESSKIMFIDNPMRNSDISETSGFNNTQKVPVSQFPAEIDTISYENFKKQLLLKQPLNKKNLRIEAIVNSFDYNYPAQQEASPIAVDIEYSDAPWSKNKLIKISVKAKQSDTEPIVAKSAKFQAEFNPLNVEQYRIVGYEEPLAQASSDGWFNIKQNHAFTVLYEIQPKTGSGMEDMYTKKYLKTDINVDDILNIKINYTAPLDNTAKVITKAIKKDDYKPFDDGASNDFKFAASAAAFGQLVKDSPFKGNLTIEDIAIIAKPVIGSDKNKAEFIDLLESYKRASILEKHTANLEKLQKKFGTLQSK